jgi:hypothetical protein
VHAVGEQRIVDLAHPHAGVLLDALDGGLGGEAGSIASLMRRLQPSS